MNGSAGAIEGCYWQADRETREVSPALSGDIKVNVAVIGGGFTGPERPQAGTASGPNGVNVAYTIRQSSKPTGLTRLAGEPVRIALFDPEWHRRPCKNQPCPACVFPFTAWQSHHSRSC